MDGARELCTESIASDPSEASLVLRSCSQRCSLLAKFYGRVLNQRTVEYDRPKLYHFSPQLIVAFFLPLALRMDERFLASMADQLQRERRGLIEQLRRNDRALSR